MPQDESTGKRDLTQGPILSTVWALSLPMMLGNIVRTTFSLVDMAFVGRLGPAALAAVGMSGMILMLLFTVFMGIATASTAMVARAIGTKEPERANHVAAQSLLLTMFLSIILAVTGYAFAPSMLKLLGASEEVIQLGTGYLHISFIGVFAMLSLFIGAGILRGAGDVITPLIISIIAAVVNIALDPLLIFGLLGFPRLGVNGAAIASVTAQTIAFLIGLAVLSSGRLRVQITLRAFRPDPIMAWKIIAIGVPNSIQMSLRFFMGLVLTRIVAQFGTPIVAAFTVGSRLQMVGFMPTFAFAQAAATLVGQNLGAGKPQRAQKSALISMTMAVGVMGTAAVFMYFLAPQLVWLFNDDPAVIAAGTSFLQVASLGYVFAGVSIVLSRSITGAGDTLPPMIFSLFALWGLQVPLAYWLSSMPFFQETGVWWAGVAASVVLAALATTYFYSGRWMRKKV